MHLWFKSSLKLVSETDIKKQICQWLYKFFKPMIGMVSKNVQSWDALIFYLHYFKINSFTFLFPFSIYFINSFPIVQNVISQALLWDYATRISLDDRSETNCIFPKTNLFFSHCFFIYSLRTYVCVLRLFI